jgi:hypothetical protein
MRRGNQSKPSCRPLPCPSLSVPRILRKLDELDISVSWRNVTLHIYVPFPSVDVFYSSAALPSVLPCLQIFHPTFPNVTFFCSCAVHTFYCLYFCQTYLRPFPKPKHTANMRFSSTILSLSLLALVASSPMPKKKHASSPTSAAVAAATATSAAAASSTGTSTVAAAADGSVLTASTYNDIQISGGTAGTAEVRITRVLTLYGKVLTPFLPD